MSTRIPIGSLDFGQTAAEQESAVNPELLLSGFLDIWDLQDTLVAGDKFIVLGYKGSGKSAIGEHIRLRSLEEPMKFVRKVDLTDLPFASFPKAAEGDKDYSQISAVWRFALMVEIFSSFMTDLGAGRNASSDVGAAIASLQKAGLLPSPGVPLAIKTSRQREIQLTIPGVGGISGSQRKEFRNDLDLIGDELLKIAARFESQSTHILVVDGLDDMFVKTEQQLAVIAALINEVNRINQRLRSAAVKAKAIVLCRTDIFERLPSPNKNKLRQDSAIELAWYHNQVRARDSKLVKLASVKARVTDPSIGDVIADRFPAQVFTPSGKTKKDTYRFLLERTRHTPRDLLRLLTAIQTVDPTRFQADSAVIRAGASNYSVAYLLPELKDELAGFFDTFAISDTFNLLSRIHRQSFQVGDAHWCRALEGLKTDEVTIMQSLSQLYEVGAIGTLQSVSGGGAYYSFRFRNPHVSFDPKATIQIHKGLRKALNLPFF